MGRAIVKPFRVGFPDSPKSGFYLRKEARGHQDRDGEMGMPSLAMDSSYERFHSLENCVPFLPMQLAQVVLLGLHFDALKSF